MTKLLRTMNSTNSIRSQHRPRNMERRTIVIALSLALFTVLLVHHKLKTPPHEASRSKSSSHVTLRPFYSLNGYNPMIRTSKQNKGVITRAKHFLFGKPVDKIITKPPKHHFGSFGATQVAYRIHPNPKGVALLLHGCGESAKTWYELPEHHAITIALHKQRFSTLAISSSNRGSKCWSSRFPSGENDDVGRVLMAVRQFYERQHHPDDFPLHGVGVSSGGSFISVFSTTGRIKSQVLYISPGNRKAFQHSRKGYPRTLFVHTMNDPLFPPHLIELSKRELVKRGVNVGIFPQPVPNIDESLYISRVPNLQRSHAVRLVRASDMREFMNVVNMLPDDIRDGAAQVRKVGEGGHAVSSTGVEDIAAWL